MIGGRRCRGVPEHRRLPLCVGVKPHLILICLSDPIGAALFAVTPVGLGHLAEIIIDEKKGLLVGLPIVDKAAFAVSEYFDRSIIMASAVALNIGSMKPAISGNIFVDDADR